MSGWRDIALGGFAFALGLAWFHQAAGIEDSLLSDAVGAGGVPKALAAVMAAAGGLLVARTIWRAPPATEGRSMVAHAKAAGLLALMIAYAIAAPLVGYPLALGVFAAGVAVFAGAPFGATTLAFGVGTAGLFWLGFVKLLGVAFPVGALFGG